MAGLIADDSPLHSTRRDWFPPKLTNQLGNAYLTVLVSATSAEGNVSLNQKSKEDV
jgi:hypothetical protein